MTEPLKLIPSRETPSLKTSGLIPLGDDHSKINLIPIETNPIISNKGFPLENILLTDNKVSDREKNSIKKETIILDNMESYNKNDLMDNKPELVPENLAEGPIKIRSPMDAPSKDLTQAEDSDSNSKDESGSQQFQKNENPQIKLLLSQRSFESPIKLDSGKNYEFPPLTIDDINTSLKVIGDLNPGRKLKIVNSTHLADEISFIPSVSRYSAGQGRDRIFGYLEHMYLELVRNINLILSEIRSGVNRNQNTGILRGIICKLAVFLHKYENMRSVYHSDSSMYARLGNNRDKFHVFLDNFFFDVTAPR